MTTIAEQVAERMAADKSRTHAAVAESMSILVKAGLSRSKSVKVVRLLTHITVRDAERIWDEAAS